MSDNINNIPPELQPDENGHPPEITPALLAKLRNRYFTVRHVFLKDCGHKLDMINEPRHRHCENCWFQWLNSHPKLIEVADQMFREQGRKPMEGLRGKQFTKMFVRYMSTVIQFMKEEGRINEQGELQSSVVSEQQGANTTGGEGKVSSQKSCSETLSASVPTDDTSSTA
jgi:hypothetical protein